MLDNNWSCVYSTIYEHEVQIVKAILLEHEIESVAINKRDSNYLFGNIEIYVPKIAESTALQLINKMKSDFFEN